MKFIVEERGKAVTYELSDPEVTIGRGLENTIPIRDPLASRRHIKLTREGDAVLARDLGSRNGTLHNQQPLRLATLATGDCLRVGETRIWFGAKGASAGAAPPPAAPPPAAPPAAARPGAGASGGASDAEVFARRTEEARPKLDLDAPPAPRAAAKGGAPAALKPIPIDDDDDLGVSDSGASDDDRAATPDPGAADPGAAAGAGAAAPPAPSGPRFSLEVRAGADAGKRIELPGFPFRIGRRKLSHYCLRDDEASGAHCELVEREPDGVALVDLDSTNGTFVNGGRVKRAVLNDGAEIRVGDTVLVFRDARAARRGEGAPDPSGIVRGGAGRGRGAATAAARSAARTDASPAGPPPPELEEASGLAEAAGHLGAASFEGAAHAGGGAGGLVAAALLLVAVLGGGIAFIAASAGGRDDAALDPAPVQSLLQRNWSFEEGAPGRTIPGWAAFELVPGAGAGEAEVVEVEGPDGVARELRLEGAGATLAAVQAVDPIDLVTGIEVRAVVQGSGVGSVLVRWESSAEPQRWRLATPALLAPRAAGSRGGGAAAARSGRGEVRVALACPEGFDRARVLLAAQGTASFDRVVVVERDDLARRAREVQGGGGLSGEIDERGVVRLDRDGRTVAEAVELWIAGDGPAAPLASQQTPFEVEPIEDLAGAGSAPTHAGASGSAGASATATASPNAGAGASGAATAPPAEVRGHAVRGSLLPPAGPTSDARPTYRVALERDGAEVRVGLAVGAGGDREAGAPPPAAFARLRVTDPALAREVAVEAAAKDGAVSLPWQGDEVAEVALGSGGDQVSLRFDPPVGLHARAEGQGAVLELRLPASGKASVTLGRGSTRERRALARLMAEAERLEADGQLEAARALWSAVQRQATELEVKARAAREHDAIVQSADAALSEAAAIEADVADVGVAALIDAAEQRCRFVVAAFPGTPYARRAGELLERMGERRQRLQSAQRIERAQLYYEAGRRHLEKSRYRLARVYFDLVASRYEELRVAEDARRDAEFCAKKLAEGGS